MKQSKLRVSGEILILLGLIISIWGVLSYHNVACSCPAEIVGQPPIPCPCTDSSAVNLMYFGITLVIIGLIVIAKSFYKKVKA
jgi:uncharacterized protein YjeT (DUF2065 family)